MTAPVSAFRGDGPSRSAGARRRHSGLRAVEGVARRTRRVKPPTRRAPGSRPESHPASRAVPRSGTYLALLGTIAVLNAVGVVMVLSASSVVSITSYGSAWYFFERQLLWTVLGVVAFVLV